MRGFAVTVSVLVVLLAGCSDTPGDSGTSPPEVTTTSENTDEPAPEPTEPESTQPQREQPSLNIASLPVGGSPIDGWANCTSVNLTDTSLPGGTTIELGSPSFDPKGVFDADQSACPGDLLACPGVKWTADSHDTCYVGVRQAADSGTTTLQIPGKATCESQDDCNSLEGRSGSQILLTAQPSETPSGG